MAVAEISKPHGKSNHLRILVAEDEPQVAEMLSSMLKSLGHTVIATVNSGAEAIRLVRGNQPDLVIMDLGLPDMDGISATRVILHEQNIALIFCSGLCNAATMESARQLGVHGYLVKPFTRNQLYTTVNLALAYHTKVREVTSRLETLDSEISDLKVMTRTVELMAERYKITHEEATQRLDQIAARRGCKPIEAARAVLAALQGPTSLTTIAPTVSRE